MRLLRLLTALLPLCSLAGCEQIIDFEQTVYNDRGIDLNAVATPGAPFTVSVSRTWLFNEVPALDYDGEYWDYVLRTDSFYYKQAQLPEADVRLTVNGGQEYALHYDATLYAFTCDYVPAEGDVLHVQAQAEGFPTATAETTVPQAQKLEVLDHEKYYDRRTATSSGLYDMAVDTVMRLTLRLSDPPGERNYYRLKVRSIGDRTLATGEDGGYYFSDVFSSADVIFMDPQLVEGCYGWPAYFSNVFDDRLFDGTSYTFTVETRMRYGHHPRVVVELQSITSDLYYYLKSIMLYRITDQDAYTEAIQIFSNVEDGWGIVGSLSGEKHTVSFGE